MAINSRSGCMIRSAVSLCLFASALSGCQTSAPSAIQASELTIVDQEGNVLIRLKEQGGNGAITLYDQNGQMLVSLVARQAIYDVPAGGELALWRPDEMLLFSVYPTQNGSGISMYSPGRDGERRWDRPSIIIETTESGEPKIKTESGNLILEQLDAPD